MAFDLEKLKVGDVFYSVKERSCPFRPASSVHNAGSGRPLLAYELIEHKVLGILTKHLEGKWKYTDPDGDLETEYFVESVDSTHVTNSKFYFDDERTNYFVYKQEALDYIKILETADKELDKT